MRVLSTAAYGAEAGELPRAKLQSEIPPQTKLQECEIPKTYPAIPKKPRKGKMPQMTPKTTAMICRNQ